MEPIESHSGDDRDLIEAAMAGVEAASAPRSGYEVGAAVETASGAVYVGANVELPPDVDGAVTAPRVARETALLDDEVARVAADVADPDATNLHAEVVALAGALADGHDAVGRVAVATHALDARPPCETCRPVLRDHAADEGVEVVTSAGSILSRRFDLDELGPWVDELEFPDSDELIRMGAERVLDGESVADVEAPDGPARLRDLLAARTGDGPADGEGSVERDGPSP